MNYLIDTHVFIWFMMEPEKLSQTVYDILTNEDTKIYISPISFWEMAIKYQSGKLNLGKIHPVHFPHIADQYNFDLLTPDTYDYVSIAQVPQKENHHDPFDRMLIQQAIRNNMVLLSNDEKFRQYEEHGLQLLW